MLLFFQPLWVKHINFVIGLTWWKLSGRWIAKYNLWKSQLCCS